MTLALAGTAGAAVTHPRATKVVSASGSVLDKAAIALLPKSFPEGSTLHDGLEASQPPWEFVAANGTLEGIDLDVAHAIASRLGMKITVANVNFATLLTGVQTGRYNISTSGYGDNPLREKIVDMIDYARDGNSLLIAAGNPSHVTMQSVCGQPVAMLGNSQETETSAPDINAACAKAGKQPIQIVSVETSSAPVVAVTSGRAVAALMGTSQAAYIIKQQPGKFAIASGGAVAYAPTAFAVAKHSPLDPALLKVLNDMKADGAYQKILSKWGVSTDAVIKFQIDGAGKA
jgi:polar amino acid transport system substrate-binding protein